MLTPDQQRHKTTIAAALRELEQALFGDRLGLEQSADLGNLKNVLCECCQCEPCFWLGLWGCAQSMKSA